MSQSLHAQHTLLMKNQLSGFVRSFRSSPFVLPFHSTIILTSKIFVNIYFFWGFCQQFRNVLVSEHKQNRTEQEDDLKLGSYQKSFLPWLINTIWIMFFESLFDRPVVWWRWNSGKKRGNSEELVNCKLHSKKEESNPHLHQREPVGWQLIHSASVISPIFSEYIFVITIFRTVVKSTYYHVLLIRKSSSRA